MELVVGMFFFKMLQIVSVLVEYKSASRYLLVYLLVVTFFHFKSDIKMQVAVLFTLGCFIVLLVMMSSFIKQEAVLKVGYSSAERFARSS